MKIKHLQLNTSILRSPEKVIRLVREGEIDVACLQEITYTNGEQSPLVKLVGDIGYFYIEGVHFCQESNNQLLAAAIISKFPIVDYYVNYYNSPEYEPKLIKESDLIGKNILGDNEEVDNFPGSRGLKHWLKSRAILTAVVDTGEGMLRVMTTHYTVSDHCTETVQMYEMSKIISSLVKFSNNKIPTIFSGDLNIRPESYSVAKLSEVMTCHTKDIGDTLAKTHIARQHGFPDGLALDHVFSKGLAHKQTGVLDVDFSEHKAVISVFEK